jgi:cytochrome c oxidase cbb3-type subunit 3
MSAGWSIFVIVLTIVTVVGSLWLLFITAKVEKSKSGDLTTGHVWDGDLREYNKPLPRWWLWLFIGTVVFSAGYVAVFPGFGALPGTFGWSSEAELKADLAEHDARARALFAEFRGQSFDQLMGNQRAQQMGRNLYATFCTGCHGADARGNRGFPNLTDGDWLWGGDEAAVLKTITDGRLGVMPAWRDALGGNEGVNAMVEYVKSLSNRAHDARLAAQAKPKYDMLCVACHGPTGDGSVALGAPRLNDAVWLHGGDNKTLFDTIANGRNGNMPAHGPLLGDDRVRVIAAWVLAQSQTPAAPAAAAAGGQ